MTFPPPWTHSPNPTEVRRADDGRIALHITVSNRDWTPENRWVLLDTPNGQLQLTCLSDDEVADWTPLGINEGGGASC